ncbi:toxin-antitoxin system, toxin component, HicA domain protein [Cooperia oncophora]
MPAQGDCRRSKLLTAPGLPHASAVEFTAPLFNITRFSKLSAALRTVARVQISPPNFIKGEREKTHVHAHCTKVTIRNRDPN